jgi:acetylornithine deacetylase
VPGLSAHACVRDQGVSAIECFWVVHRALLAHEREKNDACDHPLFAGYDLPYPLSIGTLQAGNWPSSVPEELVCEGRYGIAIGEDMGAAQRLFEEVVATAAKADPWLREHPPEVEWWGGQFASAETSPGEEVVTRLCQAFADLSGAEAILAGVPYGADMRLLIHQGQTPTVLFGPGDVCRAHRPDEFVPIAEMVKTAQTLALLALRFCGVLEPTQE